MFAAQAGNLPITELLLAAGADIDAQNSAGNNALYYANEDQRPDVARRLERAGATASNHLMLLRPRVTIGSAPGARRAPP